MVEISEEEYRLLLDYKKLVENAVMSYIVTRQIIENNIPLPRKRKTSTKNLGETCSETEKNSP